jgi:hypothetical protein
MRKTLSTALLLCCAACWAQTLNVKFVFTDYTSNPSSVNRATATALGPTMPFNGTVPTKTPVTLATGTNGTVTFSNLVPGIMYQIQLVDRTGKATVFTNGFYATDTNNSSGYFDGWTRMGVKVGDYFAYFTPTNFTTITVSNTVTLNQTNVVNGTASAGTNTTVTTVGLVTTVSADVSHAEVNTRQAASGVLTNLSLTGAITNLTQGANVTITGSGGNLTIASTGGSGSATNVFVGAGTRTTVVTNGTSFTVNADSQTNTVAFTNDPRIVLALTNPAAFDAAGTAQAATNKVASTNQLNAVSSAVSNLTYTVGTDATNLVGSTSNRLAAALVAGTNGYSTNQTLVSATVFANQSGNVALLNTNAVYVGSHFFAVDLDWGIFRWDGSFYTSTNLLIYLTNFNGQFFVRYSGINYYTNSTLTGRYTGNTGYFMVNYAFANIDNGAYTNLNITGSQVAADVSGSTNYQGSNVVGAVANVLTATNVSGGALVTITNVADAKTNGLVGPSITNGTASTGYAVAAASAASLQATQAMGLSSGLMAFQQSNVWASLIQATQVSITISSNSIFTANGRGTNTTLVSATVGLASDMDAGKKAITNVYEIRILSPNVGNNGYVPIRGDTQNGTGCSGSLSIGGNVAPYNEYNDFIAGGTNNDCSENTRNSAIIGGMSNLIGTSPGGGSNNFIGGGFGNIINTGVSQSWAAGMSARAAYDGDWVWADPIGGGTPFVSTKTNQFLIRSLNGVGINTNDPGANALRVLGSVDVVGGLTVSSFSPNSLITSNVVVGSAPVLSFSTNWIGITGEGEGSYQLIAASVYTNLNRAGWDIILAAGTAYERSNAVSLWSIPAAGVNSNVVWSTVAGAGTAPRSYYGPTNWATAQNFSGYLNSTNLTAQINAAVNSASNAIVTTPIGTSLIAITASNLAPGTVINATITGDGSGLTNVTATTASFAVNRASGCFIIHADGTTTFYGTNLISAVTNLTPSAGDYIWLDAGFRYLGPILITNPGTRIIGASKGRWDWSTTNIVGGAVITNINGSAFSVLASNCVFENFGVVQGNGNTAIMSSSIQSTNPANNRYENLIVGDTMGACGHGLYVTGNGNMVKNCEVYNTHDHGFLFIGCNNSEADNVLALGNRSTSFYVKGDTNQYGGCSNIVLRNCRGDTPMTIQAANSRPVQRLVIKNMLLDDSQQLTPSAVSAFTFTVEGNGCFVDDVNFDGVTVISHRPDGFKQFAAIVPSSGSAFTNINFSRCSIGNAKTNTATLIAFSAFPGDVRQFNFVDCAVNGQRVNQVGTAQKLTLLSACTNSYAQNFPSFITTPNVILNLVVTNGFGWILYTGFTLPFNYMVTNDPIWITNGSLSGVYHYVTNGVIGVGLDTGIDVSWGGTNGNSYIKFTTNGFTAATNGIFIPTFWRHGKTIASLGPLAQYASVNIEVKGSASVSSIWQTETASGNIAFQGAAGNVPSFISESMYRFWPASMPITVHAWTANGQAYFGVFGAVGSAFSCSAYYNYSPMLEMTAESCSSVPYLSITNNF